MQNLRLSQIFGPCALAWNLLRYQLQNVSRAPTRSGWKIADVDIVTVVQSRNGSNQSMKPTAPLRNRLIVFDDTLPWLISFSLDEAASLFNGTS